MQGSRRRPAHHLALSLITRAVLLATMLRTTVWSEMTDNELRAIRDNFGTRRDLVLRSQAASPYPRLSGEPGEYHGVNVWHKLDLALAALYLDQQRDEANQAILDAAAMSLPEIRRRDPKNDFHWHAPLYTRIYAFFSARSSHFPGGRLTPDAEEAIRAVLWEWARVNGKMEETDPAHIWRPWGSENHDAMRDCTAWGAALVLKDAPDYAAREHDDGSTAPGQYKAWTAFLKQYLRERIKRGMLVEFNSGYAKYTMQCWYNYCDFSDDAELRRLADAALTVQWADWGQTQIDGVLGGSRARLYQGRSCQQAVHDALNGPAWYYLDIGAPKNRHPGFMCLATSSYRLPPVVMDLFLDTEGRGVYECRTRRLGLCGRQRGVENDFYELDAEFGGIVQYTYCTPDFIMGTSMYAKLPCDQWTAISSQNRWQGVIFAGGERDARIYPQCVGLRNGKTYNQWWSVQSKGTLLTQKLPRPCSKQAGPMRIWFDASLQRVERDGWVCAEAARAYAAVRPAVGGTTWEDDNWLRLENDLSPIIIQVARRSAYPDAEAFRAAVLSQQVEFDSHVLSYTGLQDAGRFTFFADSDRMPEIDGKPIELKPAKTFDSPFLQQDWNSGIVTIRKGERELVLDVRNRPGL